MRVTIGLIGEGVALLGIAAPVMQAAPDMGLAIALAGLFLIAVAAWRIK
jgi:hypothetical protein